MKKNGLLMAGCFLLLSWFGNTQAQVGSACSNPFVITALPFVQTGMTTAGSGNAYNSSMACASTYMDGEDFVFSYTPATDKYVNITLANTGNAVGLFVLDSCPDQAGATCVASVEAMFGNPSLTNLFLAGGYTYYIIVSTLDPIIIIPNPNTPFDIQIDSINPYDAAAVSITGPLSSCSMSNENVSVLLTNNGLAAIDSVTVGYSVNNAPWVTETVYPPMNPGDTVLYTFATMADMSAPDSTYAITAFISIAGDGLTSNDTVYGVAVHLATVSAFPYFEDFEQDAGSWVGSAGSSWQWGEPAKPIINYAASPTHCYTTNLSGNTLAGEVSYLTGPCFDFSGMSNPFIRFNLWYETTMLSSSAILEASADQGLTWVKIGNATDSTGHWYNNINSQFAPAWTGSSAGWIMMQHAIDGFAGQPNVRLRLFYDGGFSIIPPTEGIAIDDIEIKECILPDAVFTYSVNGNSVSFNNASVNATNYLWDFGDGSTSSTTNTSHFYTDPGTYTVTLFAYNDCGYDTLTGSFTFTGINENENTASISVSPNPGNGKFRISGNHLNSGSILLVITDITGTKVCVKELHAVNGVLDAEADITAYSNGMYFLSMQTQQNTVNIRLIKE